MADDEDHPILKALMLVAFAIVGVGMMLAALAAVVGGFVAGAGVGTGNYLRTLRETVQRKELPP